MKIRALQAENFRKFRDPIELAGFHDGLNLVCEPNEAGKSTVLEAMRAALFENHKSKNQRIESFQPSGDNVAPLIELDFEIDGAPWRVRKRFVLKPEALLTGPDGRRVEGDAAEEQLQALLGFTRPGNRGADDESRGALGLFWVEQGAAVDLAAPGSSARRTLQSVLEGEVGAVTGGRRAPAVLAQVKLDLDALQTSSGKSRGTLKEAEVALEMARAERELAESELRRFGETLDRLEQKRGELRRLKMDRAERDPAAEEADIVADLDRAKQARVRHEAAEERAGKARLLRDNAQRQADNRAAERRGLAKAEEAVRAAARAAAEHRAALDAAMAEARSEGEAVERAREAEIVAGEQRDRAALARDAGERSRTLLAAFDRLARAEAVAREEERLSATLRGNGVTVAALAEIDKLESAAGAAQAAFEAGTTALVLELDPVSLARVTVAGAPVSDGAAVLRLVESTRIEVEGVGAFTVTPPAGATASARSKLAAATVDLEAALSRLGVADAAEARKRAAERKTVEDDLAAARRSLAALCSADPALGSGEGSAALRAALAGETRPTEASGDAAQLKAEVDATEAVHRSARSDLDHAVERRTAATARLAAAEMEQARLGGAYAAALTARDRLRDGLDAAAAGCPDEQLAAEVDRLAADVARAAEDAAETGRNAAALDPTVLEARLRTHRQHVKRMDDDSHQLDLAITRLEENAKTEGGAGPASRAEATREAESQAADDLDRLTEEAAVLRLLKDTLEAAAADASRRYLAPVVSRVDPYVRRLLPSASLSFGEDLRPLELVRGGRTEDAHRLSKGTQEQLAVLTRLAFAQLLADKGRPASVILDDALVYSDDARFETMVDILSESAERLQIIILTCRASLFRRMDATRLGLCA